MYISIYHDSLNHATILALKVIVHLAYNVLKDPTDKQHARVIRTVVILHVAQMLWYVF